ncbi:hypothetical protein [Micromonospora zhanjiangensis]|uniref:MYXO-CTERM domain-containing protein n=1 Tax=Micromonospora zhanjiangensis TaxID=1522057 RepID=A0ABV8KV59_9ACTN
MKNRGIRTIVALAVGLAVVYFGSANRDGDRVSNSVLLLAAAAALIVWFATKPSANTPVK